MAAAVSAPPIIAEAASRSASIFPAVPLQQAKASDEGSPRPQVQSAKEPEAPGEAAAAKTENYGPERDGPPAIPGNETLESQPVLEVYNLDVDAAEEPSVTLAVARSTIACYRDGQGTLHITNVSIMEPMELAAVQRDGRHPGMVPEAPPVEFPADLLSISAQYSEGPGESLAEATRSYRKPPGYIRAFRDSAGVIHIKEQEPLDNLPPTVST